MNGIIIEKEKEIELQEFKYKNWQFFYNNDKMYTTKELDMVLDRVKVTNVPEMFYGHNRFYFINPAFDFIYEINPLQMIDLVSYLQRKAALDLNNIYYEPNVIKVRNHEIWKNVKVERDDIIIAEPTMDWTYSSCYMGKIGKLRDSKFFDIDKFNIDLFTFYEPKVVPTDEAIPLHRLGPDNPLEKYIEINLFEDELGDNGHSHGNFRFRTMNDCFFGLLRSYVRVDHVIVRIIDTRIFHSYGENYILRDFIVKEASYDELKIKGFKFSSEWSLSLYQSDVVSQYLDNKFEVRDKIIINNM
jgi:type 2A phosphatase activator TIP41